MIVTDSVDALYWLSIHFAQLGEEVSGVELPRRTFIGYMAAAYAAGMEYPTGPDVVSVAYMQRDYAAAYGPAGPDDLRSIRAAAVPLTRELLRDGVTLQTSSGPIKVRMDRNDAAKMYRELW